VIFKELRQLARWEERHRRLIARVTIVLAVTLVIDVIAAVLIWGFERHTRGTEIHSYGDAMFFSTVQLLTVSSQLKNPLTTAGRIVDIVLEIWAVLVVASVGGSFATFFMGGDKALES
jgi:hypothetical protein